MGISRTALAALLLWLVAPGSAAGRPQVDLLTMGPSEQIYARFGHAALRVHGDGRDTVFNFGYTDFDNQRLVLDTLQGKASFWGVRVGMQRTLDDYLRQDRTIYWQTLALSAAQHRTLARELRRQVRGRESSYLYHHYRNNCSTRLRDLIDESIGGEVRRQLSGEPTGKTFRQLSREGFSDSLLLLSVTEYLLGRLADQQVDWWQAGFLPRLLRQGLQRVQVDGQPLASKPEVVYPRQAPLSGGNPNAGAIAIGTLGAFLALLALAGLLLVRRRRPLAGLPVLLLSLVLGLLAMGPWLLTVAVGVPELSQTELVLLLWPTDLLLVAFAWRLLRGRFYAGRWLRWYLLLRIAVVGAAIGGHLVGVLWQRPLVWLAVAGLPLLLLTLALRSLPQTLARPITVHPPLAGGKSGTKGPGEVARPQDNT